MENHSKTKNSIVLVPFPFDDFSVTKVRPALCLTETIGDYNHIIIAFISSKVPTELLESDLIIKKDSDNSFNTGLITDSVIRLHKIVTIPESLIARKLGVINKKLESKIEKKLKNLFKI